MLGARIVVTGATGYVGGHLLQTLRSSGYQVVGTARAPNTGELWPSGDICGQTDWTDVLCDSNAVIHTAGVVHTTTATTEQYQRVNVEGTIQLAKQALAAGVQRFIYVSSASVYGESSDQAFAEETPLDPQSAYAQSKADAEAALLRLFEGTPAQLFILRLPMIVGRDAPGNFGKLVSSSLLSRLLPLASLDNKRSILCLETLASAIESCLTREVDYQIFNISDQPISTPDMISALAVAQKKMTWRVPCPPMLLKLMLRAMGRGVLVPKLLGSHFLDTTRARLDLGVRGVEDTKEMIVQLIENAG